MRTRGTAPWLVAVSLVLAGCSAGADEPAAQSSPAETSSTPSATSGLARRPIRPTLDPDDPALDAALSRPVEDRVYPAVGDPGVDALHYQLDLTWAPKSETLDAVETLTFRATEDAEEFQLDFGKTLTVTSIALDGEKATFRERGKDLVVRAPVRADERYTLEVRYRGTPKPVAAPTTRDDFSTIGWTITDKGETWTMQEPFGAYSWYAVNDHPSDKALYDFTLTTRSPWVGVANGKLESRKRTGGSTVTDWHLDEPAASYLVTVAFGNFTMTKDRSKSGLPLTYWTPRGDESALRSVQVAGDELDWIEDRLGPYPFSSLGVVVVDSTSGMETQTMITLGNHRVHPVAVGGRARDDPPVVRRPGHAAGLARRVDERGHGDVPPGPVGGPGVRLRPSKRHCPTGPPWTSSRGRRAGPPANYDPATFGEGNIYYLPALMWDQLRRRIGDDRFWPLVQGLAAFPRQRQRVVRRHHRLVVAEDRRGPPPAVRRVAAGPGVPAVLDMRLLVLGGTVFLSRAVAVEAVRRGHEVTCACRGESGSVPEGAAHVAWDRRDTAPSGLVDGNGFDAVVDVARHPSWVRSAVAAFPDAHWVFVSTISVYTDDSTPQGTVDTLPTHEPIHTDEDPASGPEVYGAMKVACEQAVTDGAGSSVVIRPGLIVGPGDRSGRFSYWPNRIAEGGEVLAPGSPDERVQVIDVRDLASWLVDCAESPGDRGVPRDRPGDEPGGLPGAGRRRRRTRRAGPALDLGRPGIPRRARRGSVGRPPVTPGVAAAAGVRVVDVGRRRGVVRRRAAHPTARRHRTRHPGLAAR